MIPKQTIKFLSELKKNNNRDWFQENKPRYEAARDNFLENVDAIIKGIAKFDDRLIGMDPGKCMFRIYRDVRFSKDKSPYKTHLSARMFLQGTKTPEAGYYFHVSSEEVFLGGGIYHPAPADLLAVRHYISDFPEAFNSIIKKKSFKNTFGEIWGDDQLKNAPRGFDKEDPMVEYLRMKSFIASHTMSVRQAQREEFVKDAVSIYKKMAPFNQWLNKALQASR